MKFTGQIFERATIQGLTDYLLYGQTPGKEVRDYETRLGDAFKEFDMLCYSVMSRGSRR